jgi:hypothetical protein
MSQKYKVPIQEVFSKECMYCTTSKCCLLQYKKYIKEGSPVRLRKRVTLHDLVIKSIKEGQWMLDKGYITMKFL